MMADDIGHLLVVVVAMYAVGGALALVLWRKK